MDSNKKVELSDDIMSSEDMLAARKDEEENIMQLEPIVKPEVIEILKKRSSK